MPKRAFRSARFAVPAIPADPVRSGVIVITFAENERQAALFSPAAFLPFLFILLVACPLAWNAHGIINSPPLPPRPAPVLTAQPVQVPLPQKEIASRNFYAVSEAAEKPVNILPLLEKLPLGAARPPQPVRAGYMIDVDERPMQNMLDRAENAAMAGKTDHAIRLYTRAVASGAVDETARYNLAALLVDKAAAFDENGQNAQAIRAYEKALTHADDAIAATIRSRIAYLKSR